MADSKPKQSKKTSTTWKPKKYSQKEINAHIKKYPNAGRYDTSWEYERAQKRKKSSTKKKGK